MLVRPIRCESTRSRDDRYGAINAGHTKNAAGTYAHIFANSDDNKKHFCCRTESAARICPMRIVCCLLQPLAQCAEHTWSSGIVGSHTGIHRRSSKKRCRVTDIHQPGFVRVTKYEKKTGTCWGRRWNADGRLRQTQRATAILRIWVCRIRTTCGRQRWNEGIHLWLSVAYLVWGKQTYYTPGQQFTDTYVQNMAFSYWNQGNRVMHPRRGKNFERPRRASECTDRARSSINVSGRASRVDYVAFGTKALVRGNRFEK